MIEDAWMQHAACRTGTPRDDLFFPDVPVNNAREARGICAGCPVTTACLTAALGTVPAPLGIWGGTTFDERRAIRQGRAA